MRIRPQPRRAAAVLLLLAFCWLWAGCAGHQNGTQSGPPQAASDTLPKVRAEAGQSVHVAVSGGDAALNADLESMLTGYLQSECGLVPAEAPAADLLVRVRIEQIYPLGSRDAPVKPGQALAHTATGAMLGGLVGGMTGGRSGAAWGVGGGALVGLGVALLDSSGTYRAWGLNALVGVGRKGREPAENAMSRVSVSAEGENMGRQEILPALEDSLSRAVVASMRP